MRRGIFRDAVLVLAPAAAVLAGLAAVDHHQRLVEAGYRVASLQKERDALDREVARRRVAVGRLASPARLLAEARTREIPLDFPKGWNLLDGDEAAGRFAAAAGESRSPAPSRTAAARGRRGGR